MSAITPILATVSYEMFKAQRKIAHADRNDDKDKDEESEDAVLEEEQFDINMWTEGRAHARHHMEQHVLPRHKETSKRKGTMKFRKVHNSDNEDRGNLYPVFSLELLETFAHFGEGVGIYFMQLLILTVTGKINCTVLLRGSCAAIAR